MAGIKATNVFKAADKLAQIDSDKTLRSIAPITSQVGKIEVAVLLLLRKIEQLDPDIELLTKSVQDGTFSTPQKQNRLTFVQRALQSHRNTLEVFERRLETLGKTPDRLAQASLTLSSVGTVIKLLPIPGVSLTAGATSTFSGKLADIRAKGRDLLDAAQTADFLLEDTELDRVDEELAIREQKIELLLEIKRLLDELSDQQLQQLANCIPPGTTPISEQCLQNVKAIFDTVNKNNILSSIQPETNLFVTDFNGVRYRVVIEVVASPFSNDNKIYRRALAVRQDGMIKCVTEIVATDDAEYFVESLRRCLLVKDPISVGQIEDRTIRFTPASLLFVGSFENETDLIIVHGLDTNDFIIQVYQDDGDNLKQIVPESIRTSDNSRINIKLSQPTSGKVVFNRPTSTNTDVNISFGSLSKDISHNLSTELPLIQVYTENEVIIPEKIRVLDDNTIRVELSEATDFKVVTFNPPSKNVTTITNNTTQIQHNFNVLPPLVQVYFNDNGPVQIIPEEVEVIDANTIQIKLSSLSEYRAIIGGATKVINVNILSCTLGIAITDVTPIDCSLVISVQEVPPPNCTLVVAVTDITPPTPPPPDCTLGIGVTDITPPPPNCTLVVAVTDITPPTPPPPDCTLGIGVTDITPPPPNCTLVVGIVEIL